MTQESVTREETLDGLVIRSQSGFHTVYAGGETVVCSLPGRFTRGRRTVKNPVVVGDRAVVRRLGGGEGVIERLQPRRNELARAAAGGTGLKQVLAANLDLVVLAVALREPALSRPWLDRFLLAAEQSQITPVILVTKLDLGTAPEIEAVMRPYQDIGYHVLFTSSVSGLGLEAFRTLLAGRISTIIGASGVGKSTILNTLQPGLHLKAGAVSAATGKGRHTTTVAELIALDAGGYLADTPGLRELALWDVEAEELPQLFPEMRPYLDACRFARCTHLHEPGCAVRRALEEGLIDADRYATYTRIRTQEIQEPIRGGRG